MNQTIYPIGIQNFEKIRKDGYLYIDKTALIYQLVKTGSHYFLSRPSIREEPVAIHAGGLFPREKGAVRGTYHGETGEGLDQASDLAFRLEYLPLRRP